MTRAALEARWLELTREVLPSLAGERGWPIRHDHCFQRVLLDVVFGDVWYAHVTLRPAYREMPEAALGGRWIWRNPRLLAGKTWAR